MDKQAFYNHNKSPILGEETEFIKSTFSRDIEPIDAVYAPIHIFGTGSDGNSMYIKHLRLLVDIGLPKNRYLSHDEHFFDKVDTIVITHHHGDHFKPATLRYILSNYKHITVYTTDFFKRYIMSDLYGKKTNKETGEVTYPERKRLEPFMDRLKTIEKRTWVPLPDGSRYLLAPLTVKHGDIVNIALQLYYRPLNMSFLYATDLDNLNGTTTFTSALGTEETVDGLSQSGIYNVMFLEANYDENLIVEKVAEMKTLREAQYVLDKTELVAEVQANPHLAQEKATELIAIKEKFERDMHNIDFRAESNKRHISEQEAFSYVKRFLKDDGLFIPLHASSTFGRLFQ